jgi:hypothetical protein
LSLVHTQKKSNISITMSAWIGKGLVIPLMKIENRQDKTS